MYTLANNLPLFEQKCIERAARLAQIIMT